MNLSGKSFLKLLDFTPEEINGLLDLASELKQKKKCGEPHKYFEGKNIALIFEKTSTRTAVLLRWRRQTLVFTQHI